MVVASIVGERIIRYVWVSGMTEGVVLRERRCLLVGGFAYLKSTGDEVP